MAGTTLLPAGTPIKRGTDGARLLKIYISMTPRALGCFRRIWIRRLVTGYMAEDTVLSSKKDTCFKRKALWKWVKQPPQFGGGRISWGG